MTRSQRISHENLRLRDAQWLQGYEQWLAKSQDKVPPPPMLLPLMVRGLTLKNRIVVSPMAMYSAVDGVPQDFHLVHLGARALGGAALVFVEMTAPCPGGRITPGCTGLWNDVQMLAFKRIVNFVHASDTDQVNSIIAAGRADLCALARPHLADPAWTLHEAAKLQSRHANWPQPYLSGRDQLYREVSKQKAME